MAHLKEFDVVRIIQLDQHLPSAYIVECIDKNGLTIWLADFTSDELELVESVK